MTSFPLKLYSVSGRKNKKKPVTHPWTQTSRSKSCGSTAMMSELDLLNDDRSLRVRRQAKKVEAGRCSDRPEQTGLYKGV